MSQEWKPVPLWTVADDVRQIVDADKLPSEFFHYSIPVVDATGTGRVEGLSDVNSAKLALRGGEVLVSKLNPRKGRVLMAAHSELPIVASPEFIALRPHSTISDRFLCYLLSGDHIRMELEACVQSATRSHQRVTPELVRHLVLRLPSRAEQEALVSFLDAELSQIDELVQARVRMRSLLSLKRQRMVEKILNIDSDGPSVPLKYAVQSVGVGIVITPARWYVDDGGVPALRGLNIRPGTIDSSSLVQISHEGHVENIRSRLLAGDVVVVRTGQAGAAAVVPESLHGCNCIDLLIVRPGVLASSDFLVHFLNSSVAREQVSENSVGSIQAHFNVGSMKKMRFPRVGLDEQKYRSAQLDEIVRDIDGLDLQIDRQLALLNERRQVLVTAAVTGQIDVSTASGVSV